MTRRATQLEDRLIEWGREYGGGRYDNHGWQGVSPLATLMLYHGRAPQGLVHARIEVNGEADQVEAAVRALGAQDAGWKAACVIRAEYMSRDLPMIAKRDKLRGVGATISERDYFAQLRIAKVHIAAWIRVPFDEPISADDERCAIIDALAREG